MGVRINPTAQFHLATHFRRYKMLNALDVVRVAHKVNTIKELLLELLYLYRAPNKITQLSIPTHAQLQHHRLKFIKNHLKNSYMFRSSTIFRSYNVLAKITIIIDHSWMFLC